MNKADELRAYLNNAYGMEKEWPKTFQVGAATYGEVCQAIFNHIVDDNMETLCPLCNAKMVSRKNKEGRRFWGCPNFPHCRGTRDSEGKSKDDRYYEKNQDVEREDVDRQSDRGFTFRKQRN